MDYRLNDSNKKILIVAELFNRFCKKFLVFNRVQPKKKDKKNLSFKHTWILNGIKIAKTVLFSDIPDKSQNVLNPVQKSMMFQFFFFIILTLNKN